MTRRPNCVLDANSSLTCNGLESPVISMNRRTSSSVKVLLKLTCCPGSKSSIRATTGEGVKVPPAISKISGSTTLRSVRSGCSSAGQTFQPLDSVGEDPEQPEKHRRLIIGFAASLFPPLQCPWVHADLPGEDLT